MNTNKQKQIINHCFIDRNNTDSILRIIYENGENSWLYHAKPYFIKSYIFYSTEYECNCLYLKVDYKDRFIEEFFPLKKNAEVVFVVYEDHQFEFMPVDEFTSLPQERFMN
jgi:hypothetical protein